MDRERRAVGGVIAPLHCPAVAAGSVTVEYDSVLSGFGRRESSPTKTVCQSIPGIRDGWAAFNRQITLGTGTLDFGANPWRWASMRFGGARWEEKPCAREGNENIVNTHRFGVYALSLTRIGCKSCGLNVRMRSTLIDVKDIQMEKPSHK